MIFQTPGNALGFAGPASSDARTKQGPEFSRLPPGFATLVSTPGPRRIRVLMIRFISCLRRRPDIDESEFRQFWDSDEFADLVSRMATAVGADHYQFKRTLVVEANESIRKMRGGADPYDGVIEYWFTGRVAALDDLLEIPATREVLAGMQEFQSQFVDLSRSCGFFTEG